MDIADITSVILDGDNFKIDVYVGSELFRFKAKGTEYVLVKDPEQGIMKMEFDPAMAQSIYRIIDEFLTE